jgi:hypothetical protein
LSAPEGNSVNSYIEEQFCKVKYAYLDQIFDQIYDAGHRIRPNSTSCCNLSKVSYLFRRADSKFLHSKCTRGPI